MRFNKIFSLFKKSTRPITTHLDKKLLKKISKKNIPSWRQLTYIWHFLNNLEKRVIKIVLATLLISIGGLIFIFLQNNKITVATAGGEYTEAFVGQPKFINPLFSSTNDVDSDLTYLIYSGLFHYNDEGKLLPDLASQYTITEDGKNYTISLRKDALWSDGEKFTADDVIFTFSTIQNPLVGSPLLSSFQGVTVSKIDDYSVKFILKEPFGPFLSSLTTGILPSHIWQNLQPLNIKLAKNNLQPVGSGAWKFDKLVKDPTGNIQSYELVSNEKYYKQTPYLKKLIFKFYPDYIQAVNAIKSQEVDGISFAPSDLKSKISDKNFNFVNFNLPQYTALFLNQNSDQLKDDDLRLALKYATDKKQIKQLLENNVDITNTPFQKGILNIDNTNYYNLVSSTALLSTDWKKIEPEKYFDFQYKKLLKNKEAEISKITEDASSTPQIVSSSIEKIENEVKEQVRKEMNSKQSYYLQDEVDNILEITITTFDTDEYKKVAEEIAKMWQQVGIKTKIKLINRLQLQEVLKKRDYDILLYAEITGADPDNYPFWHSSQAKYPGLNLSNFNNAEADKLLVEARKINDLTKRKSIYQEFQTILEEEIPAIFLYTPSHTLIINKEIKGVTLNQAESASGRYNSINNWYTKTKHKWTLSK